MSIIKSGCFKHCIVCFVNCYWLFPQYESWEWLLRISSSWDLIHIFISVPHKPCRTLNILPLRTVIIGFALHSRFEFHKWGLWHIHLSLHPQPTFHSRRDLCFQMLHLPGHRMQPRGQAVLHCHPWVQQCTAAVPIPNRYEPLGPTAVRHKTVWQASELTSGKMYTQNRLKDRQTQFHCFFYVQ